MRSYLYYIYTEKCGKITDLIEKFGEDSVRQMKAIGYIENANEDIWYISTRALNLAKQRYRKSTIWERILDWFNLKIRKLDFRPESVNP